MTKIGFCFIYHLFLAILNANSPPGTLDDPLFISLGSWCDVAQNLRKNEMRHASFPFDWIASVDCEQFLEIFRTDFKYFLEDEHLFIKDSHVFNNYYRLEFPHDIFLCTEASED